MTTAPGPAGRRLLDGAVAHPVAAASAVAAVARLVVVVASFVGNRTTLIPDEAMYLQLARHVARGRTADSWYPGYGQSLYRSTWTFMAPLVQLVKVFGSSRLVGQLYVAVVGVAVVALVVVLARRVVAAPFALGAGLVAALLPSSVVLSSVVLREAHVWAALAAVALGAGVLGTAREPARIALGVALTAAALLALGDLRQQTQVAAAWAVVVALALLGRAALPRLAVGLALLVVVPVVTGIGPGGATLIANGATSLGDTRAALAKGAETAIVTPSDRLPPTSETGGTVAPGALGIAERGDQPADDGLGANARQLPRGLVAVLLRPLPWDHGGSVAFHLAIVENLVWLPLYALAAVGAWEGLRRRSRRPFVAFPVVVVLGIVAIAALTQGNIGTAYRHRQQLLVPIAVLAAVGAEVVAPRLRPGGRASGRPAARR